MEKNGVTDGKRGNGCGSITTFLAYYPISSKSTAALTGPAWSVGGVAVVIVAEQIRSGYGGGLHRAKLVWATDGILYKASSARPLMPITHFVEPSHNSPDTIGGYLG
jgi:hypothetical protein